MGHFEGQLLLEWSPKMLREARSPKQVRGSALRWSGEAMSEMQNAASSRCERGEFFNESSGFRESANGMKENG
jgi:hypothetical protein